MRRVVKILERPVGDGHPCFVIAEIGINHNGSVERAKQLIDEAVSAGCDAVKFQKRTVGAVYSAEELARPRESPFGTTNGDLKRGLELGTADYDAIDAHCRSRGVSWSVSCWDEASVDFAEGYGVPFFKIASALLTNEELLKRHRKTGRPIILSTGMSTLDEIRRAVDILGEEDLILLHCTSTYPSKPEELNLRMIDSLREEFSCPIGYSGHEVGLQTTLAAVALGACVIERHITLDRADWGSDQAASVEPHGMARLVRDIRVIERAMGDGIKRVYESEMPIKAKLRRVESEPGS